MVDVFHASDTLGTVVTKFPNAATIFQGFGIDFCCGGARTLEEAVSEKELSLEGFMITLNDAWSEQLNQDLQITDWAKASLTELVDHILQHHHAYLHQNLPEIGELTTKILRVHGANHGDVLSRLHRQFHFFKMEMEEHLIKEETIVFPLIKQYEETHSTNLLEEANQAIENLEKEHEQAGALLKAMREITNDYELPADACRTYTRTFQLLEEMESDTFLHVHLENNIVFPRLQKLATAVNAIK